jgi:SPP1 gp7 family putative phage head morphogenesis protein
MIDVKPLAMKEAQAFWRDKLMLSPAEFRQLSDEAKVQAFAVSGLARGDELTTVFNALQRSLDEGTAFQDFKKDCKGILEKRGWKNRRIENIFRTNVQTAYSVGRYEQMKRVVKSRPYWMYDAVGDQRTRPTHAALDGKVFKADSPFWDTWQPPNGFMCRCSVSSLSERQVKARNLKVETDDPTNTLIEPVDPQTGGKLPARQLLPDKGFDHHPGKSVYGGIVDASEKPGKWKNMQGLKTPDHYRRRTLKNVRHGDIPELDESQLLPPGKNDAFYKSEFIARYGEEKVLKDVLGEPVILSLRSFLVNKTPGAAEVWKFSKGGHGVSISIMEDMLLMPFEVWLTPQKNENGKIRLPKRYIGFWKTKDKKRIGGLGVYEVVNGVFQGVTSFIPMKGKTDNPDLRYVERQRAGLLLYGMGQ